MLHKSKRERSARSALNDRPWLRALGWASLLVLMSSLPAKSAVPPFRKVLISSSEQIHVRDPKISAAELPSVPGNWSVSKTTLVGGKQDGVDLITVDNGKLTYIDQVYAILLATNQSRF